ncbi:MAG: hypothetical protein ACRCZP_19810 [Phycicoccus sp.]
MTYEEEKLFRGLEDVENAVDVIRVAVAEVVRVSSVTKSKAAETDRLTDENRALRMTVDELKLERAERDAEIAKLRATVHVLESRLADKPSEPEAPKAPAVEVMPGPDYVTRAELVKALRGTTAELSHIIADRLERKP